MKVHSFQRSGLSSLWNFEKNEPWTSLLQPCEKFFWRIFHRFPVTDTGTSDTFISEDMNDLRTQCRSVAGTLHSTWSGAIAPTTPGIFDEMSAFTTNDVHARMGLPEDGPHLRILTMPNEDYDRYMTEISAMKSKKRKNWKGCLHYKTQKNGLVWSQTYQRIHSASGKFYVVKRAVWDAAMMHGDESRVRVMATDSGLATATEGAILTNGRGDTSSTLPSAISVLEAETRALFTGNHSPHTWKVNTPAPGTRMRL